MKKFTQRFISFFIALVLLFSYSVTALAVTPDDSTPHELPIPLSVLRYFDFYYCDKLDDTVFPDYYAGINLNSDSTVTFFVTSKDPDILSTILSICKDDSIQFDLVPYSFNQLLDLQHTLLTQHKTNMKISHSSISIADNAVVIYVEGDVSKASVMADDLSLDSEAIIVLPSEKTSSQSRLPTADDTPHIDLSSLNNNTLSSRATFCAGIPSYRRTTSGNSYTSLMGTISFVALDSSGNKLIVTHGHDVEDYGFMLKVQGTVLEFNVMGIGDYNDFSYAILPSNATLNNSIASTNYSLTGTMTMSSFMSINNPSTYFYGHTSGSVLSSSYRAATYGEDSYLLSQSGNHSSHGDSGGPIFVSTDYGNQLVGIVKRGDGESYSQGVFLSYFKDWYRSETGNILYAFVNNTPYN